MISTVIYHIGGMNQSFSIGSPRRWKRLEKPCMVLKRKPMEYLEKSTTFSNLCDRNRKIVLGCCVVSFSRIHSCALVSRPKCPVMRPLEHWDIIHVTRQFSQQYRSTWSGRVVHDHSQTYQSVGLVFLKESVEAHGEAHHDGTEHQPELQHFCQQDRHHLRCACERSEIVRQSNE